MTTTLQKTITLAAMVAGGCLGLLFAQDSTAPAGRGARDKGPVKTYWVEKTSGGVYVPPNKPITRLADLKAKHAGQANWSELIVKDPEHQAVYNSAAPGTKFPRSVHPDTPEMMVVVSGELHVDIEGQAPIMATRGSIVNILRTTPYSFEVAGNTPAFWLTIDPLNFRTMYPSEDPAPAPKLGGQMVKVSFGNRPASYVEPNMPHWNLFEAAKTKNPSGVRVTEDHLFANPIYGFADPNDPLNPDRGNPGGGRGGRGGRGGATGPFDPHSTFGHMHTGPAEWWLVQSGQITARFENVGELVASEGDVLYATPMTWHQMGFKGPGPSCRLALGAYDFINMNNTAGQ